MGCFALQVYVFTYICVRKQASHTDTVANRDNEEAEIPTTALH